VAPTVGRQSIFRGDAVHRASTNRRLAAVAVLAAALTTTAACGDGGSGAGADRRLASPTVTTGTGAAGGVRTTTSELVFSGVQGSRSLPAQRILLVNQASEARTVFAAALTGSAPEDFAVSGLAAPVQLQPRQTLEVSVSFVPHSNRIGSLSAQLMITTDSGPLTLGLYGLATRGEEGVREPALADVLTTLGYAVQVGTPDLILGTGSDLLGAEVRAPLFAPIGSEVTLTAVARYSPDEDLPYGWYLPADAPVLNPVATILKGQFQTLRPVVQGVTTFSTGAKPFGIYIHSNSFGRDTFTQETFNVGQTKHAVRVYPLRDRQGDLVPYAYLLAFEDATNGDYQDYVFTLEGVRALAPS
jgi:hypothetical protein